MRYPDVCMAVVTTALILYAGSEARAFAYLDPGSGSMMLQLLLAGLLATAFTLKLYWRKLIEFLKGTIRRLVRHDKPSQ